VQRHIAGGRGYRYLSAPVTGQNVTNFGPSVSGPTGVVFNPNATYGFNNFPTCWIYNEETISGNPQYGWVSATTSATALQVMKGYAVIISGTQTLSFTGTQHTGSYSIPITYTPSLNPRADGFNLVGNPYPSPISWNAVRALPGNIGKFSNVVKRLVGTSNYGGQYADWNGTVGTNGANDNIALGQAFFVTAEASCSTTVCNLEMNNSVRRSAPAATFFEEQPTEKPADLIRLKISGEKGADEAVIYRDQNASDGYDVLLDAVKQMGTLPGLPNIYSLAGTTELSINAIDIKPDHKVIPVEVSITQAGPHNLQVTELLGFDQVEGVYLEDRLEQKFHNLRAVQSFEINAPAGVIKNRYFIHLGNQQGLSAGTLSDQGGFGIYPNPTSNMITISFKGKLKSQSWEILDITGKLIRTETATTFSVSDLANGSYFVRATDNEGKMMLRKFMVMH
jgi:hypothetical protein